MRAYALFSANIQKRKSRPLQRVIVLTAASESTLKDFHERRVYRVIKKPFDIAELAEAVEACAANRAVKVT